MIPEPFRAELLEALAAGLADACADCNIPSSHEYEAEAALQVIESRLKQVGQFYPGGDIQMVRDRFTMSVAHVHKGWEPAFCFTRQEDK